MYGYFYKSSVDTKRLDETINESLKRRIKPLSVFYYHVKSVVILLLS